MIKKILYFVIIWLCNLSCYAENLVITPMQFLQENLHDSRLNSTNQLKKYAVYDFSHLWLQKQDAMLGYIGKHYQRFSIHFNSIIKSKKYPGVYLVTGKTKVKNNINDFTGEIVLLHIRDMNLTVKKERLENHKYVMSQPLDEDTAIYDRYEKNRLILFARYKFKENSQQKYSGIFDGIMKSKFYLKNNKIYYDDIDSCYDSYSNNSFVGIWKSYTTGVIKQCDFGNYRIPYSGDLDCGAGYFGVNSKYVKYGWKRYDDAYKSEGNKKAEAEEKKPWW